MVPPAIYVILLWYVTIDEPVLILLLMEVPSLYYGLP